MYVSFITGVCSRGNMNVTFIDVCVMLKSSDWFCFAAYLHELGHCWSVYLFLMENKITE